jgi:glutamyl-tRNA synthetase
MKNSVRVRFAPSPTGHLHVGNARTAILNWIFAKHAHGKFILRIEDTDIERSTEESERTIFEDLRWLGLEWDEGPIVGGRHEPYRQSQRIEIYRKYLDELKHKDMAYPCYCTEAELKEKRKIAIGRGEVARYNRKCLNLTDIERKNLEASGRKPVWRFQVRAGEIKWEDSVKGRISFETENIGDFIIVRSDGLPTYNFAAAIDDALMEISHIIRGDDHVSNTPKQILIYNALGWPLPQFCHIPMILGPDRTRLSKRHGATSVHEFRAKGYLPEALINFLSLLSWSSESGDEILSVESLIKEFDFQRMSQSPAIFDTNKLNWMNGHYIRTMDIHRLVELAVPFLRANDIDTEDTENLTKIISLIRDSVENLAQLSEAAKPFFQEIQYPTDGQAIAASSKDSSQKVYWAFLRHLRNFNRIDAAIFRKIMKQVQKETGVMGKDLWLPIRVALTGKLNGPELPKVAEILGKEKCERFVEKLID